MNRLQTIQNKAARTITGADIYTRTTQLHESLDLQYLIDIITNMAKQLKQNNTSYINIYIRAIGTQQVDTNLQYRTPHLLTL